MEPGEERGSRSRQPANTIEQMRRNILDKKHEIQIQNGARVGAWKQRGEIQLTR